ncbi:MAG TPA: M23 family metallopeptidase [Spirochaetia bacterium]|nr:M23 family metallopeptidase [Spirochaetia bacterium]
MSPFAFYKQLENNVADLIRTGAVALAALLARSYRRISMVGQQRVTILLIPHTEKKIASLRVSFFSLIFLALFIPAITAIVIVTHSDDGSLSRLIQASSLKLSSSQASLQKLQDRVVELERVSAVFNVAMNKTMSTLGISGLPDGTGGPGLSPIPPLSPPAPTGSAASLQSLIRMVSRSAVSLREITSMYESHVRVLAELPTMWPVQGGAGIITTNFGPAIEPFTHSMYLHVGIDIADRAGTPLVAAGDGTVIEVAYQPLGYGNFVLIRHRFGFYSRYAHLERVYVQVGQTVKQGQIIGLMGSTGLSTGPHVHFEIHLGSQVIDPMSFLDVDHAYHPTMVSQD